DVGPVSSSPDGCTPTQKKQHSNGAKTTAAKTHTSRRTLMPDLNHLLGQIDRLDKEAEAGPWITGENDETGLKYFGTGYCDCCTPPTPSAGVILGETGRAEAEFIALARTALPRLAAALKDVMELHEPRGHRPLDGTFIGGQVCDNCRRPYPCQTVQAVTDQMGEAE